jgi:intracellular septation protein
MVIRHFLLSLLIEFGPMLFFFLGATAYDFFVGVWFLIVTTTLSIAGSLWRDKRVPLFSLIASAFVLLSGAVTLFTADAYWVVLEYALYNFSFALAMLIGYVKDKPALKILFKTMFHLTDKGWHILSLRWGLFFLLAGIGSEYTYHLYGEDIWVYYRFMMGLVLAIFGFSQFFLARHHRLPDSSPWGLKIY